MAKGTTQRELNGLRVWCTAIEMWRQDADIVLARRGLTWSGFRALLALSDEPHRSGELRAEVGMTSGGMAKLLSRLEAEGLVRRRRNADEDHRIVIVELTARGRRLLESAAAEISAMRDEDFEQWGIDEELRAAVHQAWEQLQQSVAAEG